MSKDSREAAESAPARLCEWRRLNCGREDAPPPAVHLLFGHAFALKKRSGTRFAGGLRLRSPRAGVFSKARARRCTAGGGAGFLFSFYICFRTILYSSFNW